MDAGRAPGRIRPAHLVDQRLDRVRDAGPPELTRSTLPAPVEPPSPPVPPHGGSGLDNLYGLAPPRTQPREEHPQPAINAGEALAPRRLALEDGELMPKRKNLRSERETRPNRRPDGGEQGNEQCGHAGTDGISQVQ